MGTLKNRVDPLHWKVPISNENGTPTPEFQRKWEQQAATNGSIPDLTTAKAVSVILDLLGTTIGSLLVRGQFQWSALLPNTAGYVLTDGGAGATPTWAQPHYVPAGGTAGQVLTKNSGADYDLKWAASGVGGGAASIKDDGTNVYVGVSDSNGQLVLDSLGDPVWAHEVFPPAALPLGSASAFGAFKVDGNTIAAVAGVISGVGQVLTVTLSADQSLPASAYTKVNLNTVVNDTQGAWNNATHVYMPKAGLYLFIVNCYGRDSVGAGTFGAHIVKNGSVAIAFGLTFGSPTQPTLTPSTYAFAIVRLNGTDTVELQCFFNSSGTNAVGGGSSGDCALNAIYLGP